jgi:hypothetical protein
MPRWASKIIIAGVDFSGCRGLIAGGSEFDSSIEGSIDWAASGAVYVQSFEVGEVGQPFGVEMTVGIEASKIAEARAAIQAAQSAGQPFEVWLTDALRDIHVFAYPDYRGAWFTSGPESEGRVDNVSYKFISAAPYVAP